MIKRKGNAKLLVFLVAGGVAISIFAYMQLTTTTVYVATDTLQSGTKITDDMVNKGQIVAKSVPKSLTNAASIKNFKDISGSFVKFPIGPGSMVFSYDFAKDSDLRNNEILRNQNLEALTLPVNKVAGASNALTINDKLNIYTTETISLGKLSKNQTMLISELPTDLKAIFVDAGGFKDTDSIVVGDYKYAKLLAQNVPVVDLVRDTESKNKDITNFIIGVNNTIASNIHLTLDTGGGVGIDILPYNENSYKTKDAKGSLQYVQYGSKNNETIQDKTR